jgi:hypothetical protein
MLGRSKMKVLRTITGHLSLLAHLVRLRARRRPPLESPLTRAAHE